MRREVGDEQDVAIVLTHLGDVALRREDQAGARSLYGESLARFETLGDPWGIAWIALPPRGVAYQRGTMRRPVLFMRGV